MTSPGASKAAAARPEPKPIYFLAFMFLPHSAFGQCKRLAPEIFVVCSRNMRGHYVCYLIFCIVGKPVAFPAANRANHLVHRGIFGRTGKDNPSGNIAEFILRQF
jgi:hypothetical protein